MKIYTKSGDKGETSLFGGKRVDKDSLRIKVLGAVDELNSILGICLNTLENNNSNVNIKKISHILIREQSNLLRLGSDFATTSDLKDELQSKISRILDSDINVLEQEIDKWDSELPKLTTFILPGGSAQSAFLHHARSVCRRAEREAITLSKNEEINPSALKYLNRLSDWLFQFARYTNFIQKISDPFPTNSN